MNRNNKKAFTLIEMGIVLIILSVVIGTVISMTRASYQKNKVNETKEALHKIKQSVIGHAGMKANLPAADTQLDINGTDGKGEDVSGLGKIPYIDFQLNPKDQYGMNYMYDVNDNLRTTNSNDDLCSELTSISSSSTALPLVQDDSGADQYSVAAIIYSKGIDKVSTGANDETVSNDRKYEMAANNYDSLSNNDMMIEITAADLYARLCTGSGGGDCIGASSSDIFAYFSFDNDSNTLPQNPPNDDTENNYLVTLLGNNNISYTTYGGAKYADISGAETTGRNSGFDVLTANDQNISDWTFMTWVKRDDWTEADWDTLIDFYRSDDTANGWRVELDANQANSRTRIRLVDTQGNNLTYQTPNQPDQYLTDWNHIAISHDHNVSGDPLVATVNIYVNGSAVSTSANRDTKTIYKKFSVDERSTSSNDDFTGNMDEVYVYKKALSALDVGNYYASTKFIYKTYESCSAALADGGTQDGIYTIDPDGVGAIDPLGIYCDMAAADGPWAIIDNNKEEEQDVRALVEANIGGNQVNNGPDYAYTVDYQDTTGTSIAQSTINYMVNNATEVKQQIDVRCYSSVWFYNNNIYSHWRSQDGNTQYYMPNDNPEGCQNNDSQWRETSNIITGSGSLPIYDIWGGDVDQANEETFVKVGKLYIKN